MPMMEPVSKLDISEEADRMEREQLEEMMKKYAQSTKGNISKTI